MSEGLETSVERTSWVMIQKLKMSEGIKITAENGCVFKMPAEEYHFTYEMVKMLAPYFTHEMVKILAQNYDCIHEMVKPLAKRRYGRKEDKTIRTAQSADIKLLAETYSTGELAPVETRAQSTQSRSLKQSS